MTEPGSPQPGDGAARQDDLGGSRVARGPVHPLRPPSRSSPAWPDLLRKAELSALHRAETVRVPAWVRSTRGEPRLPVTLTIIVAIALQLLLPNQLALRPIPFWLMPALEAALLAGMIVADPVRIERRSRPVAVASIVLTFVITVANAASGVLLVRQIIKGEATHAVPLLASAAAIWITNVIAFALWYWEFDRGGPVHRAAGTSPYPDLMFPQMTARELAPPDWEPQFVDYLYLSFTNATAFSPTDVMPLARWAKLTMLVESTVSIALVVFVVARAVNIMGQ